MFECLRDRTEYFVTYGTVVMEYEMGGNKNEVKYNGLILNHLYKEHDKIFLLYNRINGEIRIL